MSGDKDVRTSPKVQLPPKAKGAYILVVRVDTPRTFGQGRTVPQGTYLYVGSARGPGGLHR